MLNRYRRSLWRRGLKLREVERAIGHKAEWLIPSDYRLFSEAANHGLPIGRFHSGSSAEKLIGKMMLNVLKEAGA